MIRFLYGGDTRQKDAALLSYLKEHAARGNIVFFSSHIIDVVERICDKITIIKKGKILVTRNVSDLEKEGVLLEDYYLKLINGESAEK